MRQHESAHDGACGTQDADGRSTDGASLLRLRAKRGKRATSMGSPRPPGIPKPPAQGPGVDISLDAMAFPKTKEEAAAIAATMLPAQYRHLEAACAALCAVVTFLSRMHIQV